MSPRPSGPSLSGRRTSWLQNIRSRRYSLAVDDLRRLISEEFQPRPLTSTKGVLAGKWIGPRMAAKYAHDAGFRDEDLFISVAVCGSESWLYTEAHNDNLDDNGDVTSRDVGLWEINIPASQIGTSAERVLYDPADNAAAAFKLWQARGWQPWVGFTSGAYLHDTYLLWAYIGVGNRWAEKMHALAVAAGQTPKVPVPALSIPQLRHVYPGVPLG